MIINSKNVFVLAFLFLLPFVAVAGETALSASKGKYSDKIGVQWSGKKGKLFRAKSKTIVTDTAELKFKPHKISDSENSHPDKEVKAGFYYYYKMNDAIDYGYIASVAEVENQKIPSDTTNSTKQPILKGEVKITKALNGNNKIVSLTIDDATVEAVKKKGGSFKVERSEKEQMMGSEVTFTKPKFIELNSIVKAVFTDKNVNDKVGRYKYVVVIFDKDGKEIRRSNEIEINLKK
jgi:hypothetical protein